MRVSKQLSTAALLLALAGVAVSCDDGDGGGREQGGGAAASSGAASGAHQDAGADGDGTSAVTGLGEASDMDGLVKLVNSATLCEGVSQKTEDVLFGLDGDDEGSGRAARIAATDEKFSIKGRAICRGESWADNVHQLMLIEDMAKFQAAYRDYQRAEGETDTDYYVGRNFAVKLNARDSQTQDLVRAGTLGLNCSPNFVPPAGYRNEPALVDGCLLTDYVD